MVRLVVEVLDGADRVARVKVRHDEAFAKDVEEHDVTHASRGQ